jgi:ParB-like chromosome segregation protein Spo0J
MGSRSHFEQLAPSSLRPYSLNKAVFGEMDRDLNPEFIAAVGRGIDNNTLTPCTVTSKNMILSGHRRIAAAIKLGKKMIPCQVVHEENSDVLNEIWADANRNREMTNEQRGRYYDALKEIEIKRGRVKPDSDSALKSAPNEDRPDGQIKKDSQQTAADAAGFGSRYKAETVSKVVDTIDKLEEQGETTKANELREVLETKPAAAALRAAQEVIPPEPKQRSAKPVDTDAAPDEDEDRTWKKSDATKFRAAFQTIIRTIDRGAELDQLTVGEHAAFLSVFKKFGNDWQKLFSEQEWL